MPTLGCNYISLAVILIDFVLKIDENYYLGESLKEYTYIKNQKGD